MNLSPPISLIVSSYNSPQWLSKVLDSIFAQSLQDFQLIVADDGSTAETESLLRHRAQNSPISIVHVWQEDQGFQKCRILNKAISVASGKQLIFTDGDCLLPPNFVQIHQEMARTGYFLTGAYFKLSAELSDLVSPDAIRASNVFRPSWLLANGLKLTPKLFKLFVPPVAARLANHLTPTKKTWNGHNSSCLREDAVAVNGFNEEIQYGGEDVEFGCRLNHYGLQGRHLRFSTVPLHLHHGHGYVTAGMRERSLFKRQETLRFRRVRAQLGLDQWLQADGSPMLHPTDRCLVLC
jgi:glycosyltransferase involved in cell wall biosynthesis